MSIKPRRCIFQKKSTINTYDIARHIIYHKKGTIYITLTSSLATQPLPWQMGPPRWNMMRVPPCRSNILLQPRYRYHFQCDQVTTSQCQVLATSHWCPGFGTHRASQDESRGQQENPGAHGSPSHNSPDASRTR